MDVIKMSRLRLGLVVFLFVCGLGLASSAFAKPPSESPRREQKKPKARGNNMAKRALMRASWYGHDFHGRRAANGRSFNANGFTAAHRSLRLGTKLEVTNPRNGKTVVVEVTDRGPYIHGRDLDLSFAAARELGIIRAGVARLEVTVLPEDPRGLDDPGPVTVASNTVGLAGAWPRAIVR